MNEQTTSTAYKRGATIDCTRAYMGSLMSFLVPSEETGGRFALMEAEVRLGSEPPPHVHDWEHEIYYVLEDTLEFYCEDKILTAGPGETVFLPQGKPHAFYIRTPHVRTLIMVQTTTEHSVELDGYFTDVGEPAESMELPPNAKTYIASDISHAISLGIAHGVRLLSPEETAAALPHYPGFGTNLSPENLSA